MLRGVILDYGGVLSLEPSEEALERLRILCGFDGDAFAAAWLKHRRGYDLGELNGADYWRLVGGEGGRTYEGELFERVLAADLDSWSVENPPMVAWLRELKQKGLRLALLSNMPREHWPELSARHDWIRLFDHVTVSYELGLAKPDEAIYRHALEPLGTEPGETLFVDDRQENVDAAAALGLQAVRYAGVERLREELAERFGDGLPLPAPPR